MTYIRELDVEFPDPWRDTPVHCEECDFIGTVEDCDEVGVRDGWVCPWCRMIHLWDADQTPQRGVEQRVAERAAELGLTWGPINDEGEVGWR